MKRLKQCMRIGLRESQRWPNARFGPNPDISGTESKSVVESREQWGVATSGGHPSRLHQKVRSAIVYIYILCSQFHSFYKQTVKRFA